MKILDKRGRDGGREQEKEKENNALSTIYLQTNEKQHTLLALLPGGMFSTPVSAISFSIDVSCNGSCFNSPFLGSKIGDWGGLMRTTLSFFSSTNLPLSFANCQMTKMNTYK